MSIDMTPEVIGLFLVLVFWLGRMTKRRKVEVEYRDRDRIIEKKVEVPAVVHKCLHDCVTTLALKMFNEVACPDFDYSDSDEYIQQHEAREKIMLSCVESAMKIHSK